MNKYYIVFQPPVLLLSNSGFIHPYTCCTTRTTANTWLLPFSQILKKTDARSLIIQCAHDHHRKTIAFAFLCRKQCVSFLERMMNSRNVRSFARSHHGAHTHAPFLKETTNQTIADSPLSRCFKLVYERTLFISVADPPHCS
jgi:hypothetical protein